MAGSTATHPIRALLQAWLLLDFFEVARRRGGDASTLTTTIFSQSFLALIVAALLYPEPPPVPFAAANLCLSTLLVALGAFDTEQPTHRRLADRVLLGTAPVRGLVALAARAAHGAFATMLITVGLALPPGIMLACRQHDALLAPGYVLLACACAGLAIGTLSVALRAARRLLGAHAAALLAGTGKALVLAFGLALFALSLPALRHDADALPIGRLGAELLPPYHAAKLLAAPAAEAWRLLPLGAFALLLLLLALALGDDEREANLRAGREGRALAQLRRLAGTPPAAGLAVFTATMLWRSPGVRARMLPLLGVPAAIAFLALRSSDEQGRYLFPSMALQFPAIYLPFVIAMLQQADHQGSRWLFDSSPAVPRPLVQRAVWLALVVHVLLPVQLLALAALVATGLRIGDAVTLSLFAFGAGGAIARAMVRRLDDLPFSRDELPKPADFGDLMAFALVLAGAGAAVAIATPGTRAFAAVAALAVLALLLRPPGGGA